MRPLGSDTFTVLTAPLVVDPRDGSEYRDWDNATSVVVTNAMVQPYPMAEKLNFEENREREFSRSAKRFFAPAGTRVESTDRIIFDGDEYDVFGADGPWRGFNGTERYVQFIGRLREG